MNRTFKISGRYALRGLLLAAASLTCLRAHANPVIATALAGTWDCQTAAMNDHGHPGAGINLKPHSLLFTFTLDGKWSMEGNGATQTTKSGKYELHDTRLLLKNVDGSTYQDWQTSMSDDAKILQVNDHKLFETFKKIPTD